MIEAGIANQDTKFFLVEIDFFFGFGPEATENAGLMKQSGTMWVLLPK